MRDKAAGYARLTELVESHGKDFVTGQYEMRYSEGESNVDIARSMGIPWYVLHRWLCDNAPDSIENAKAARTEVKLDQAERDIEGADIESVGLVKAQADFALRLAGKRYRKEYGESVKVENSTVVTIDVRGLLERRAEKLVEGVRVVEELPGLVAVEEVYI